jgi:hypothetical protein
MNPIPIKEQTATKDLIDNLGNPHTPCPLVHPFPIFVPNPTKNPLKQHPAHPIPVNIASELYDGDAPDNNDFVL